MVAAFCSSPLAVSGELGREHKPNELADWGRVVDLWNDCNITFNSQYGRLEMHVPGTPHVLSAEVPDLPMNAPRVVRPIRGDFTASVRVIGRLEPGRLRTTHYDPYHGAGLIIWQDASNYLRLERAVGFMNGRHNPYINFEVREGGRLAESHGISIPDRSIFLKLRRHGTDFSAWYSHDSREWVGLGTLHASFIERVEVGVIAVNSARRALTAELEWLSFESPQGSMIPDVVDPDHQKTPQLPPP
jgi:regulation of enolase protein 1 (concanavalin A-like superfamily)